MILFDAREVAALSLELPRLGIKGARVVDGQIEEGARDLVKRWAVNAEQTSGDAAKHYPKSIDYERLPGTDSAFEVGPNPAKKQGKLGHLLEYGSPTSPPHLNGVRAAEVVTPIIEARVAAAFALLGL